MKLFIFGSTGDLVKRKVLSAIQNLDFKNLEVWALGRKNFTKEIYTDFVCEEGKCTPDFKKRIFYKRIDLDKKDMCEDCLKIFDKDAVNYFYVSLPPDLIGNVLGSIADLKKQDLKIRVLIEKPFGSNLNEAINLKGFIENYFSPEEVYLSDHYLFKDGVISLKKSNFRKFKAVSLESVGLEGRTSYYNSVGALRDMVQSHFLNIALKLGKINPNKIKVVRFNRMQYGNGEDSGYVKELGRKSSTETLVDLKIKLGNSDFEFITGKAFDKKLSFIEIDGKRISLEDTKNPYEVMFSDFLSGNNKNFPTIKGAVTAWKIIEKIETLKPELKFYKERISADEFLKKR